MQSTTVSANDGDGTGVRAAMGLPPRATERLSIKFRRNVIREHLTVVALDAALDWVANADFVRDLLARGIASLGESGRLNNQLYDAVPGLRRLCFGDLRPVPPATYPSRPIPGRPPARRQRASTWTSDGIRNVQVHMAPGYELEAVIMTVKKVAPTLQRDGWNILRVAVWEGLECLGRAGALPPSVVEAVPELATPAPVVDARPIPAGPPAAEPWTLRPDSLDLPSGTQVALTRVEAPPAPAREANVMDIAGMFEIDD